MRANMLNTFTITCRSHTVSFLFFSREFFLFFRLFFFLFLLLLLPLLSALLAEFNSISPEHTVQCMVVHLIGALTLVMATPGMCRFCSLSTSVSYDLFILSMHSTQQSTVQLILFLLFSFTEALSTLCVGTHTHSHSH